MFSGPWRFPGRPYEPAQLAKYDRILSVTVCNRGLVKRHLLSQPVRDTLAESWKTIQAVIAYAENTHKQFKLEPAFSEDPEFKDAYIYLEDIRVAMQLAACRVAAASVVQETTTDQSTMASKMIEKCAKSLPKALLAALKSIRLPAKATPAIMYQRVSNASQAK